MSTKVKKRRTAEFRRVEIVSRPADRDGSRPACRDNGYVIAAISGLLVLAVALVFGPDGDA